MGIKYAIQVAVILAFAAAATGQLPLILTQLWKAQAELVNDSKTKGWGKALLFSK